VLTIEVDAGLVRALRAEALLPANAELVHADALALDWPRSARERAATRVVANLPYAISAPLLRGCSTCAASSRDWSVMIQRDVADRLLARAGQPQLLVAHRALPAVRDAAARARSRAGPVLSRCRTCARASCARRRARTRRATAASSRRIETVVRAAFGQRRKTLANALRGAGLRTGRRLRGRGNRPARARREPRARVVPRAGERARCSLVRRP
jgi:16S rRNA (adenine1518-N6/adenine1519-N6)-dimethyltransferase